MNTNDITAKQFDTLLLICQLAEFSKQNQECEDYKTLESTVNAFLVGEAGRPSSDFNEIQFIKDVYALKEKRYVVADVTLDTTPPLEMPCVKKITRSGLKAMADYTKKELGYKEGTLSIDEWKEKVDAFLNSREYKIIFGIAVPTISITLQIISMF